MEHLDELERNDFCNFDKPRKCSYQKGKIESNSKARKEASRNELIVKGGMPVRVKALEKLIVERTVREVC